MAQSAAPSDTHSAGNARSLKYVVIRTKLSREHGNKMSAVGVSRARNERREEFLGETSWLPRIIVAEEEALAVCRRLLQ
jgi:hypothetical protein